MKLSLPQWRLLLSDLGFTLGTGEWDGEVWYHEMNIWVFLTRSKDYSEGNESHILARPLTRKQFFTKFMERVDNQAWEKYVPQTADY